MYTVRVYVLICIVITQVSVSYNNNIILPVCGFHYMYSVYMYIYIHLCGKHNYTVYMQRNLSRCSTVMVATCMWFDNLCSFPNFPAILWH